jgi:hypothetical protein
MALTHREGVYNSALTIAGGAFLLSLSFIGYFQFRHETIIFLKVSWLLLGVSIVTNILQRYFFTEILITNVNKAYFQLDNEHMEEKIKYFFKMYRPEAKYVFFEKICFWLSWTSFIVGLSLLLYFGWINT